MFDRLKRYVQHCTSQNSNIVHIKEQQNISGNLGKLNEGNIESVIFKNRLIEAEIILNDTKKFLNEHA